MQQPKSRSERAPTIVLALWSCGCRFLAVGLPVYASGAQPDELPPQPPAESRWSFRWLCGQPSSMKAEIRQVLESEQWAQWQYSPEEWQRGVRTAPIGQKCSTVLNLIIGPILARLAAWRCH
jgi:hypothetical protein